MNIFPVTHPGGFQGGGRPPATRYLSLKEASTYSGLSRTTLYRVIAKGELKTVSACGRRLIALEELINFIEGKEF